MWAHCEHSVAHLPQVYLEGANPEKKIYSEAHATPLKTMPRNLGAATNHASQPGQLQCGPAECAQRLNKNCSKCQGLPYCGHIGYAHNVSMSQYTLSLLGFEDEGVPTHKDRKSTRLNSSH